jgi:serine/threonine protein kinase
MSRRQVSPRVSAPDLSLGAPGVSAQPERGAVARDERDEDREPHSIGLKLCPQCAERYPADFRVCPRDATELEAAPDEEDPLLGSVLSETYELVRVIGEGGMGRVYEARHRRLASRRFAIKVLHAELARQSEVVSRFQREAEATSGLTHANVVGVIDVNRTADGRPYIVAELLEGEQLGDYLERVGRLDVSEAVHICRQVCAALMAAHERDIVHRDIKPENVFLVGPASSHAARAVKVLDFGISRVGEAPGMTKTGMVMGTPAYMPPEQARGLHVDHRADIYAVGAILYQSVTGQRPFEGTDLVATLASVLADEPARPCTLNSALPPALEMTIQRAMAKNPSERHRSMLELDAELARFDAGPIALRAALTSDAPTQPLATRLGGAPTLAAGAAVKRARLQLVVLSVLAACFCLVGLLDSTANTIRWIRGAGPLSATELVLICTGTLALSFAPAIAWVRHLRQRIWPSTPRAVELVARMRRLLIAVCVTYAAAQLGLRLLEAVVRGDPAGLGWPGWSVITFVGANLAGLACWAWERARQSG